MGTDSRRSAKLLGARSTYTADAEGTFRLTRERRTAAAILQRERDMGKDKRIGLNFPTNQFPGPRGRRVGLAADRNLRKG